MRVAVLTVSDTGARGERTRDLSGDCIVEWVQGHGFTVTERAMVADEIAPISATLERWADEDRADLVLTTGGTGFAPRDVTPEATAAVLEREAPGVAEALRMAVYPRFHRAALSRGTAGIRRRTLIVNLPGSPAGVRDGLAVLDDLAEHAVRLVRGEGAEH